MYAVIHPNEPLGSFKLWLEKRNSLMLACRFESVSDVDPQAYYSESHLDTFGLCIFLALEKRESPESRLLVFDDVLTSVDQPHLERTMVLLEDEAPTFGQVIVTTHYYRLFEDFKRRHSARSAVQFMKLRAWSLRDGIAPESVSPGAEGLVTAMAAGGFDKKEVAWRAGVLLESMLDHLTSILECKVARRPQARYTLGDLLPAVISVGDRLKSGLKATKKDILPASWNDLQPVLRSVSVWADVRNALGAHFSLEGVNLSDNDAKAFGQLTLDLHALLVCPACGEMVRRDDSKSHWECGCRMFCLMPLKA
jgi:hypothetical protein